jgi:hypothetical protein
MPSFYDGKRFFLTFPTIDRSPQELVAFLQGKAPLKTWVVARELHEDGQPHLHACVEFASHQRRPVTWLDDFGIHPNKQDPRKWQACIQYTKKGGDYIDGPEQEESDVSLQTVLDNIEKEEDWMEYCLQKKISFQYAQWFWHRLKSDFCTITEDYQAEGRMCDQLANYGFNPHHKTLIIRGKTGTGKTTWALKNMPKPALLVRHIDALKRFRPGFHKSIIFDDVDFCHFPRTSQIHLVDWDCPSDIHCRNVTATIPAGVFKVFTCNEWPLLDDPAIRRRVHRVTIAEPWGDENDQ